jgi:hypothetical protein
MQEKKKERFADKARSFFSLFSAKHCIYDSSDDTKKQRTNCPNEFRACAHRSPVGPYVINHPNGTGDGHDIKYIAHSNFDWLPPQDRDFLDSDM